MACSWSATTWRSSSQMCDRVAVMYAGQVVESAETESSPPRHPYTPALLRSLPSAVPRDQPLATITGDAAAAGRTCGTGCRFADRCQFAQDECRSWDSELVEVAPGHGARCVRSHEIDLRVAARTTPFEEENA